MDTRLKSLIATVLINGALGYALITGLAMSVSRTAPDKMTLVNIAPPRPPPPRALPPMPVATRPPPGSQPVILHDWAAASPVQRDLDFIKTTKWVQDNLPEEEKRFTRWREAVPQGSGPGKVTRLRPANLATHTLYWPASWSKGALPIIAWGNGHDGKCGNTSLPYAAFLSEIASYGYFVVAVGNDDIEASYPEGLEILADGRPIRTQTSALTKAIDWAVAENSRAGSPYAGKLDTGKIAYMGHGCGGSQAMNAASGDPRVTTTVVLNAAAHFRPDPSGTRKAALAFFAGAKDDGSVLELGDANFAKAQAAAWPMYKAVLNGMNHDGAYSGPDRRWSKAVLEWLNWQLKGDSAAAMAFKAPTRQGWSRVEATGL